MKCLLLVCLFLILTEFAALACHCPHCHNGHVCVGTDPDTSCVCVTDQPKGRPHLVQRKRKHFDGKKGRKSRTRHMKKVPMRKRVKPTKHYKKKASRKRN